MCRQLGDKKRISLDGFNNNIFMRGLHNLVTFNLDTNVLGKKGKNLSSKEKMEQNVTHSVLKRLQRLLCPISISHKGNWGLERSSDLSNVTQWLTGTSWIESSLLLCCYDSLLQLL